MKRLLKYKTFEAAEQVPHLWDLFEDIQEEIEQYFVELEDIGAEIDYKLIHIPMKYVEMRINKKTSYSIDDITSVINSYFSEDYTLYFVVSVSEEESTYSFPGYLYNKETFDKSAAKLDDVILFTKSGVNAISRLRKKYEVFWNGDIRNLEIHIPVKPTADNIEQKKELARKILQDVLSEGKKPRIQKALDVIVNTSISLLSRNLSSKRISKPFERPLYEYARLLFFKGPITKGVLNSHIKKIESSLYPVNVTILDEDETLKIMQSIYDNINKINLKSVDKFFSWKRYWKQAVILKLEVPEDKIGELLEKQLPDEIRKVLKITSTK